MANNFKTYTTITTDTSTAAVTYQGNGLVFYITGTFDNATVTIESSDGGGTWISEKTIFFIPLSG